MTHTVPTLTHVSSILALDPSRMSPASRDLLMKAYAQIDPGACEDDPSYDFVATGASFYGGGINGAASLLLIELAQRGPVNPKDAAGIARNQDVAQALLSAYADAGIVPPQDLTPSTMLALYDAVLLATEKDQDTFDLTTAHAVASALSMGDIGMALTITDAQGAGIGWDLTREDFCTAHGISADGTDR